MSQLLLTGLSTTYTMNVVAFSSPIFGQINSAQTKTLAVHFPIKMAQPSLQLDVQFLSQSDFQNFQAFVRNHQQQLASNASALVTLNWPDRSILNYTGFIPQFQAGGQKANYAPRARFTVMLVNSFITSQTDIASVAANWQSIYGGIGMINGFLSLPTGAQQDSNIVNAGLSTVSTAGGASISSVNASTVTSTGITAGSS